MSTKEELARLILHQLNLLGDVASVSLIEDDQGETLPVVGVETRDGAQFFVEVQDA
jgi:hypothetical protein